MVSFLIVALALFIVVKGINRLQGLRHKKEEADQKAQAPQETEMELLAGSISAASTSHPGGPMADRPPLPVVSRLHVELSSQVGEGPGRSVPRMRGSSPPEQCEVTMLRAGAERMNLSVALARLDCREEPSLACRKSERLESNERFLAWLSEGG